MVKYKLVNPEAKHNKKISIYAHNDKDGVLSAVLFAKKASNDYRWVFINIASYQEVEQEYDNIIRLLSCKDADRIVFLDFSPNKNLIPQLISRFNRRVVVFDHHKGWNVSKYNYRKQQRNVFIDDQANSCAEVIANEFGLIDDELKTIVMMANISDSLKVREAVRDTDRNLYETFLALSEVNIATILKTLLEKDFKSLRLQVNYEKVNTEKQRALEYLLTKGKAMGESIYYAYTFEKDDLPTTMMSEMVYEMGYDFMVLKVISDCSIYYIISHNNVPGIDLVEIFNLDSGNPNRITVTTKTSNLDNIFKRLGNIR